MEPVSIYLAGVLVAGLVAPAVGLVGFAAGSIGGVGLGTGTLALAWPVALPAAAMYLGVSAVTPDMPAKRDLAALNAETSAAGQYVHCNEYKVPVADIEKAGGYHAFSSYKFPLEKIDSPLLKIAEKNELVTHTNWRGNTVFEDLKDRIPKVTADWVGNHTTDAGEEVADLRVCTLKTSWSQK